MFKNKTPLFSIKKIISDKLQSILRILLILLLTIIVGGAAGYAWGILERVAAEKAILKNQLEEQINSARQDIEDGRYEIARQRLEWVLEKDSNYPGIKEMLVEVQVKISIKPTLSATQTPTFTPTPDTRSQELIFFDALEQIKSKDWNNALASLDSLRKVDKTYRTIEVDGMYYLALRNRGVDQILGRGAFQTTNLEGGIYDLTLAERFGPLDNQALGLRNGARMFIQAASFVGVDWPQAATYFKEVYQNYPGLRDADNVTSGKHYYNALLHYGDIKAAEQNLKDSCKAIDLWKEASTIIPLDEVYKAKYNALIIKCDPPKPKFTPEIFYTATPEEPPEPSPTQ